MSIFKIPDTILRDILLMLPAKTLHNCRQVSSEFNNKVIQLIWTTKYCRKILRKRIQKNWLEKKYKIFYEDIRHIFCFLIFSIFVNNSFKLLTSNHF